MSIWDVFKYWLLDKSNKPDSEEKKIIKKIDAAVEKTQKEKPRKVNVLIVRDPEENLWPFIEKKWKDYRYKASGSSNYIKPTRDGEGYGGIWLKNDDAIVVNRSKSRKSEEEFKKIYIHERLHSCGMAHGETMTVLENQIYKKL